MSAVVGGFPDWQRITQWFGTALDTGDDYPLGAGAHAVGPLDVRNFASVVVCVAPVGGSVTVKVDQLVPGGPAGLKVTTSYVVAAGNVDFHSVVLLAGAVTITFTGSAGGETLDYAIVPSNVNISAEVSTLSQLGFQHNDVAVANETAIDFEDATGLTWTITDDPGNTRVKVTPVLSADGWTPVAGAFAYSSADGPTGVMSTPSDLTAAIGPGDRIKYVQSGTTKYGIVTAIAAGTITFYGGTDYTLANVAVTGFNYSHAKRPAGFNASPTKWQEVFTDSTLRSQGSASGGWQNFGGLQITVPIGAWELGWKAALYVETFNSHNYNCWARGTLSTANNTESDPEYTCETFKHDTADDGTDEVLEVTYGYTKPVLLAAKTTYFLNAIAPSGDGTVNAPTLIWYNSRARCVIRAVCAYL
jgi:hypothetical protein